MVIWTLARKDLRLLMRDPRAVIILLAMPLIFILVLGISLGDNFGKTAASGLRITVLVEDDGVPRFFDRPAINREAIACFAATPGEPLAGCSLAWANDLAWFPHVSWTDMLLRDLNETGDIRVEPRLQPGRSGAPRQIRQTRGRAHPRQEIQQARRPLFVPRLGLAGFVQHRRVLSAAR